MSSLPVIVNALVPIAFVIMLGFLAGQIGLIKPENSDVLGSLVLDFCLPALLFNATAAIQSRSDRCERMVGLRGRRNALWNCDFTFPYVGFASRLCRHDCVGFV